MNVFGVFLIDGDDEKKYETVSAETKYLAADMAEKSHLGWRAIAVVARWDIAGRCSRCRAIVFTEDRPTRSAGGQVTCYECT